MTKGNPTNTPSNCGVGGNSGSRASTEPQERLGPLGFDPGRDGFNNARLLWVLAHFAEKLSKETALLSYGAWNPLFCSADASERSVELFAELRQYVNHYAAQAAIAMETQRAETEHTGSVAKP